MRLLFAPTFMLLPTETVELVLPSNFIGEMIHVMRGNHSISFMADTLMILGLFLTRNFSNFRYTEDPLNKIYHGVVDKGLFSHYEP